MTKLEHCGALFGEDMDWLRYLRSAVKHDGNVRGLRDDLDLDAGLGELYEALAGTPMQAAMASAALTLVEQGTPEERKMMHGIPYEEAPEGKERLLKLLVHGRDRLNQYDVGMILYNLLEKNLGDPEVAAALRRELERPDFAPEDLYLAARHLPDWLIQNLPLLRPPPPVDGSGFMCWMVRVPEDKQQALLDSIAALGRPYVDAMIADHLNPRATEETRREEEAFLCAHPVFRQALAEALKKSPS
jgi:hypothetical protein